MNWEDFQGQKNRKSAYHKSRIASQERNYKKCPDCGLYGCVCQMTLPDWVEEDEIKKEDWMGKLTRLNKKRREARRRK